MNTNFDILISFRTPSGFRLCGQYFLGKDRELAEMIFSGLQGKEDSLDKAILHFDLMETMNDIPLKIRSIGCKLDELSLNSQHITREIFRANAISTGE
jgi:hypothetical protein